MRWNLRMKAARALAETNRFKDAKALFAPLAYEPHLGKDMRQLAAKIMTALAANDSKSAVSLLDKADELAKKKDRK